MYGLKLHTTVQALDTQYSIADFGHSKGNNAAWTALKSQNNLSLFIPLDRAVMPALLLLNEAESSDTPKQDVADLDILLKNVVRRLILDIVWDYEKHEWKLYKPPLPKVGEKRKRNDAYQLKRIVSKLENWISEGSLRNAVMVVIFNLRESSGYLEGEIRNDDRHGFPDRTVKPLYTIFDTGMLYTPKMLSVFRKTGFLDEPSPYYNLINDKDGHIVGISNGWPSGKNLIRNKKQIILGIGVNQLASSSKYNFDRDRDYLFTSADINGYPMYNILQTYINKDNCFHPAPDLYMNSEGFGARVALRENGHRHSWSWPYYFVDTRADGLVHADTLNFLSACGFLPVLTQRAPLSILTTALWSWAKNEPSNPFTHKCALINATSGRWFSSYCQSYLPAACMYVGDVSKIEDVPNPYDVGIDSLILHETVN